MKKLTMTRVLTPLAALAFALGVQAKDYAKDDFEVSWSNSTGGYSFTNGVDQAEDATALYTYDQTIVAPDPAISPIGGASNTKGLKLSTEDGILFRNLTGANIGDGGLYVDTDVQFTLTDKSDRPEATSDDKFIIWLEEDAGKTNLCVWAREYALGKDALDNDKLDFEGGSNKVYKLKASSIVPGTWHRLTVKAIKQTNTETVPIPGFQVYLDNTLLTSDQTIFPAEDYGTCYGLLSASAKALVDGNGALEFFPSMSASLGTLSQVGFKGEGMIDDFVVSDNIPSSLPRVAVNVTLPAAVACATLMGTDYTSSPAFLTLEPGQSFTFSMADLKDSHLRSLEGYSFKLDEGDLSNDWNFFGNVSGSYDETSEKVTITALTASATIASFTIALEQSNSAKLTLDLSRIEDYLDKIDTLSCTVGGVTTTISNLDLDDQVYFDGLQLQDSVTLSATLLSGVSGVAVFTVDSGATGSGSTFTITDNSAWINVTLAEPVAMVGDQVCTTFAEALAAAKSTGYAIQMCGDLALEEAQAIAANETVTIDLNGYTITGADDEAAFTNAGTLTITDTSEDHDGGVAAGDNGYVVANTGTLNLVYGAYDGDFTNSGTFEITTDCEFSYDLDGIYEPDDGYVMAETYTGSGTYKLALVTYTITYMNGESEVTGLTPATYTVEDDVTLPTALPVVGVTLTGWQDALGNDVEDWDAGEMTGDLVLYAQTAPIVPVTPWWTNPQAVVLAENLPGQTGNIVSAFHGQGSGNFLGLTYSTNPLHFDLFGVDGTNALTTIYSIESGDAALTMPGFRGVAISETLGVAMTLAYYAASNMYTFPLTPMVGGYGQKVVTKPSTHAFDAAAFSPDGTYLFSNAIAGEGSDSPAVLKWSVSSENGEFTLTKIGRIDASGRNRNIAYARINGRDLVFALAESGKVDVIDMTGDDTTAWTTATLLSDLPKISYGSLCLSGVKVTGGTPCLTVATSANNGATKVDVLNVYELTVPASGAVTATLRKSFDEDALTAAGFGDISDANRYGNTVYVTDDNKTIYFARPDNKLYAAQYVEPPSGETIEPGEQSTTTYESQAAAEAAAANVTVAAASDVETALGGDTTDYLAKFEKKVVEVGETGTYKVEIALTAAAEAELEDEATTNVAVAVAAQLPTVAAAAVGSQTAIAVTGVVPGFYYSISYGTAVNAINTEGARVLAPASGSITLQTPAKASGATSGFYRVNVNVTDVPPPPPNQD